MSNGETAGPIALVTIGDRELELGRAMVLGLRLPANARAPRGGILAIHRTKLGGLAGMQASPRPTDSEGPTRRRWGVGLIAIAAGVSGSCPDEYGADGAAIEAISLHHDFDDRIGEYVFETGFAAKPIHYRLPLCSICAVGLR